MLVFQILREPSQVPIVQYIFEHVHASDLAFQGTFKDPQDASRNVEFVMNWSESVRLMCFLFIGAITASILARTASLLIASGTTIMKLASVSVAVKTKEIPKEQS
jgi:hypothetical protein